MIQEGDSELYEEGKPKEELEQAWKRVLAQTVMAQKMAGTLPAGLERWFNQLVKPKLNVGALLRQYIREGIGKVVVSNWYRPSRKHPELPWIRRFTRPKIWALVDTSASISERELATFIGACYEFANLAQITVIAWDADAYEPVVAKSRDQLLTKLKGKLRGGGGTTIRPALQKLLEELRNDVVVILTDSEIYDLRRPKTRKLLRAVSARALASIWLTTYKKPKLPVGWRILRL